MARQRGNKRQIMKGAEYMKDSKLDYAVYSFLQENSFWQEGESHRYIYKRNIDIEQLAKEFQVSRRTIQRKFEYLVSSKVIQYDRKNGVYKLPNWGGGQYVLIPNSTLRILKNAFSSSATKAYCFYHSYTTAYGCYSGTRCNVAESIGLSTQSKNNLQVITDINNVLLRMNLIQIEKRTVVEADGQIRTRQIIRALEW